MFELQLLVRRDVGHTCEAMAALFALVSWQMFQDLGRGPLHECTRVLQLVVRGFVIFKKMGGEATAGIRVELVQTGQLLSPLAEGMDLGMAIEILQSKQCKL